MIRVQYGCGLSAPAGWINFDSSPTLQLQRLPLIGRWMNGLVKPVFPKAVRYGDIVKGLPLPPRAADLVYCSHVLEHLALHDLRQALRNTFKCMRTGGIFRMVLPDLRALAEAYVSDQSHESAPRFMRDTYLGHTTRRRGLAGLLRAGFGNSLHLWMWDFSSLSAELAEAGFKDIRRASFGDSMDSAFAAVEELHRWDGQLGIECQT
jgi:SAM-dependent methyltransferase